MQWLLANVFLLSIICTAAGLMWALAALMWHFGLPPDDYPFITIIGMLVVLVFTYHVMKRVYAKLQRKS